MAELTLRWKKFGLNRGLHEMLRAGQFVDVTLACQGEFVQAHKNVLSACSPHFRDMFCTTPCKHPVVFMQNVKASNMHALLEFMYTGETTVPEAELPGFLDTADALRLSGLNRNQNENEEASEPEACSSKKPRMETTDLLAGTTVPVLEEIKCEAAEEHTEPPAEMEWCMDGQMNVPEEEEIFNTSLSDADQPHSDSNDMSSLHFLCQQGETVAALPSSSYAPISKPHVRSTMLAAQVEALETALRNSLEGNAILQFYEANGHLRKNDQNEIARLVIDYEFDKLGDNAKKIPGQRFLLLRAAVVALFPTENEETYYVPYKKDDNGGCSYSGGKLWSRYTNRKKKLSRLAGVVQRKPPPRPVEEPPTIILTAECREQLEWLCSSVEPWQRVTELWEACSTARMATLTDDTAEKYIETYPALHAEQGLDLLLMDYIKLPEARRSNENIKKRFLEVRSAIIQQAQEQRVADEYITIYNQAKSEETRNYAALLVMSSLLPPTTKRYRHMISGTNINWRPTIVECNDNFIAHVRSGTEVKAERARRQKIASERGLSIQPYIMIIAENLQKIEGVFISIGPLFYKVDSVLGAIDSLFKAFHVLNMKYPLACVQVWLCIQKCLFNLHLRSDPNFTCVNSLLSTIQRG